MKIDVEWLPPFLGSKEIAHTSAALQIHFGSENATRLEDEWSLSVQQGCRVSAYPFALWLASSWWRIRWEPLPSRIRLTPDAIPADAGWRMSHELPAAGHGYIWPRLTFASDGEDLLVTCRPSPPLSAEPVRYLSDFETVLPAASFERETDRFIDLVLRRLDGVGNTSLHKLWQEVLLERRDPAQSAGRRLEARLGCDPDEAPLQVLNDLFELGATAGPSVADEIAAVCAGESPAGRLEEVRNLSLQPGIVGAIELPGAAPSLDLQAPPWQRAQQLAAAVRTQLGLGPHPVSDKDLASILHVNTDALVAPGAKSGAPLGLAVRNVGGDGLKLLFRKRNRPARRFEAARFLADYLTCPNDLWLPTTDAATARQKVQRAFAAEFLCPIDSLKTYLGTEFLPEAFEEAAEHFGISEMAVKSHLANHYLIPRSFVDARNATHSRPVV